MTIGTSADRHDLAALKEPLRSHGGLTEQEVPFIVNRVMDLSSAPTLRNFDAFYVAAQAAALEEVGACMVVQDYNGILHLLDGSGDVA